MPILLLPIALELDEQWSFVGRKSNQRWLWMAINHYPSEVLAYTFGSRTHEVCKELTHLLAPFNVTAYFTDGLKAYQRLLPSEQHEEGKPLIKIRRQCHILFMFKSSLYLRLQNTDK